MAKLAKKDIKISWDKTSTEINIGEGVILRTCSSIARYLARTGGADLLALYGGDNLEANTEIDHWLTFSLGPLGCHGEFKTALDYLDDVLGPITFLVGDSITIADYVVFGTLFASGFWQVSIFDCSKWQNPLNFVKSTDHTLWERRSPTDVSHWLYRSYYAKKMRAQY